jgi:hypothetical protein
MRPRGIAIATFLTHAAMVGPLLALAVPASADPIAEKALPAAQTAVAAPGLTETVAVVPVVAAPTALPATTLPPTALPAAALSQNCIPSTERCGPALLQLSAMRGVGADPQRPGER